MLSRSVVLHSSLPVDECQARLAGNLKPIPAWATWWRWPGDTGLWGSASPTGFRVQLGRARQLAFARGAFTGGSGNAVINVTLSFHTWVIPYLVASAAAIAVLGFLVGAVFREGWFMPVALLIAALGLFSNLTVGLWQQKDLLRSLERILEARRAPS